MMIDEHLQPDTFTPPLHNIPGDVRKSLINYWSCLNYNLHRMKQVLELLISLKILIDTDDSELVSQKPYSIAMKHYDWEWNDTQIIHSSHSSWSEPIIAVPKGDGRKCLVIDYRALNKVTRKLVWSMPRVEDIFSKLNSAMYFSTLDLHAGFHHTFWWRPSSKNRFYLFFWKIQISAGSFWIGTSTSILQELMNKVLKDLSFAIAYIDDIIIYSTTAEEHLDHLQQILTKLCNAKLCMKLSNCHFFAKEIQYLGHIFSIHGIKPLPSKMAALKIMKP